MAKKKSLLWHLFSLYLFITLISLVGVTWYASASLKSFLLDQIKADLRSRALLIREQMAQYIEPLTEKEIDKLCKLIGPPSATRFTVILPWGKVVGDSEEDPAKMDNHSDRPEIIEALNGMTGVSTRYSPTVQKNMMYVAESFKKDQRTVGVVRASIPIDDLADALRMVQIQVVLGGLVMAVIAAGLSLLVSQRIRRPIEEIRRGAERFSQGDFQHPLPVSDLQEIGELSETLNTMAQELQKTVFTITEQRNELEAVLSSMAEGVFGVDMEERVLGMNPSAARILGSNPATAQGRTIQEVIRRAELQRFVVSALSGEEPVEKDLILYGEDERIVRAHGTPLRDAKGKRVGALIVLNDVTRLVKLENIRKDFVANVSHEIKTPITAIKGFVETLREGAMQSPKDAERFLGIIQNHVQRLESLVEDLLSLSRIEEETEKETIALEEKSIKEVLAGALQLCQVKAEPKQIRMVLSCGDDVVARINPSLLEQAVVNLLDNAVKYCEPGKSVWVEMDTKEQEILIRVRDEGCGIAKQHQERLFERFYRVDKARSRKLGGTGLGLAIVKHIMEAHGGRVSVESQLGRGSIFTLHLPRGSSQVSS
jgi:two-component system phosphate regulon sensor histidine kinase PhoR